MVGTALILVLPCAGVGGSARVTRTAVDISNHHLGTFVGKKTRSFGADTLACAGDDGYLAGEHARRVVEVLVDLVETVGGSHDCVVYCSRSGFPCMQFSLSFVVVFYSTCEGKQERLGSTSYTLRRAKLGPENAEARRGPKVWG